MSRGRIDVLRPAVAAAGAAALLAGLALLGTAALGAGVFVVQVVVGLAWLAALDAKGGRGAFVITVLAAAAADIAVAVHSGADLGEAAPVAGIAIVVAFLHQLSRRPRPGLTLSLATTISAVTFALCTSAYLALVRDRTGDLAVAAGLVGVAAAMIVARLFDVVLARPPVFRDSRRGIVGVVAGCVAAAVAGAAVGSSSSDLTAGIGLRLGLIAALLALIADIAVDLVLTQAPPQDERPLSALTPLSVLLPIVLAGPVAYVAGRILLS